MSGAKLPLIAGIAVLLVAAIVAGWLQKGKPAHPGIPSGTQPGSTISHAPTNAAPPATALEQRLQSAANALASASAVDAKRQAVARLRESLAGGDTNGIPAAIRHLLNSKMDAGTGLGFKIAGNGSLAEAPTLRTFLLDQLAQFNPAAAAVCAREILNTSNSPDEWAIALRNLARGDQSSDSRALLETKTGELLRNESWQRDPSVGYLEAFDTAVYLGGTNLLSPLSDLVRKKDNQAVAHAAFLTLDRLAIQQPAETLAVLAQHPEWMAGREETRADYFARADVGDAAQRTLVEAYLLDALRSPAELQAFAGVFPNANFMISHNLLTENATLSGATLRQRDQAALAVVNQWLADPRFEKVKPALTTMQQRLGEFTRQGK